MCFQIFSGTCVGLVRWGLMKKYLPLVPAAAAAAILFPLSMSSRAAHADAAPPVPPAILHAAVDNAEAQRKAAVPPRIVPTDTAADLDKMANSAAKVDPAKIDPKLALNALDR
jgi:hypothetical protein